MKKILACLFVLLSLTLVPSVTTAVENTPPLSPLENTTQNLMTLLSDGEAVGYSKFTMVQTVSDGTSKVALVVFSLEGFSGGNNWEQYFAVFLTENDEHYRLIDVTHIGGGGWRTIEKLNAKTSKNLGRAVYAGLEHWDKVSREANYDLKNGATIEIDALENAGMDSPNFPSKKATIKLVIKQGRLYEQSK
jgi:hypothetical protein